MVNPKGITKKLMWATVNRKIKILTTLDLISREDSSLPSEFEFWANYDFHLSFHSPPQRLSHYQSTRKKMAEPLLWISYLFSWETLTSKLGLTEPWINGTPLFRTKFAFRWRKKLCPLTRAVNRFSVLGKWKRIETIKQTGYIFFIKK